MKHLSSEQKAKAEARRERFRGLCKQLAGMSQAERLALTERFGAVVTCEGRALSGVNTWLCMLQRPGVSIVGGFRQWKKAGRYVRKGESSLSIWVPCGARGPAGDAPALVGSEMSQRELVEAGEGVEGGRPRFICGAVFDISQTEECGASDEGGEGSGGSVLVLSPAACQDARHGEAFALEGGLAL